MIRRDPNMSDPVAIRFCVAALLMLACAPVSEAPPPSNEGGVSNGQGGSGNGSGGTSTGLGGGTSFGGILQSGGSTSSGGMSSSGGASAKGGTTSVGSGGLSTSSGGVATGSGGAAVSSGGATVSSGGAATGSGGAASACMPYDGTIKADSLIFTDGQGTSTKGMWKGYAYTYSYGKGTTVIKPVTSASTSCLKGKAVCANGSVGKDDGSGAGIGWNVSSPAAPVTGSVTFVLKGATAGMRIALGPATGDEYCYNLTTADVSSANGTGLTLKASDFKQACYSEADAIAYKGQDVKSVQVSVPGSATAATPFDFCIVDIEPSG